MVPLRVRDPTVAESLLRLPPDGPQVRPADDRMPPLLPGGDRWRPDQAQSGSVPRTRVRASLHPVSAVGLHRAGAHAARAPDGDPVRLHLDAAVPARMPV